MLENLKFNKKFFTICFILIALSVNSVNAYDINSDNILSESNELVIDENKCLDNVCENRTLFCVSDTDYIVNKSINCNLDKYGAINNINKDTYNNLSLNEGSNVTLNKINNNSLNVDIVMSNDEYSCGPAALATVLNRFGNNISLEELSKLTNTTKNGTTMQSLINVAKCYNLSSVGAEVEFKDLKENYILHLTLENMNHWVVLNQIESSHVVLADSSVGIVRLSIEEFCKYYTNQSIIITKDNKTLEGEISSKKLVIINKTKSSLISGKGLVKKIIGYKTYWKYGFIKKYGWKLQPVISPTGAHFSQWMYVKGTYYVWGKYKVTKPIYKVYYISNEALTSVKIKNNIKK